MPQFVDLVSGRVSGPEVECSVKNLGQMDGIFADEAAWKAADYASMVYRVSFWRPVEEGAEGGLFWGDSTVFPGKVGDEYYMTRGHFHTKGNRGEYYATVAGKGMLLLMNRNRETLCEVMSPGSLHYIRGETAHRVVNTGEDPLTFVACWPSDAGHDYATIDSQGFSVRVVERSGQPTVIAAASQ